MGNVRERAIRVSSLLAAPNNLRSDYLDRENPCNRERVPYP